MYDHTVVDFEPVFYELEDLFADVRVEVHLINFLVSPVKTEVMNSNGRPVVWNLGVGTVNDLFDLVY